MPSAKTSSVHCIHQLGELKTDRSAISWASLEMVWQFIRGPGMGQVSVERERGMSQGVKYLQELCFLVMTEALSSAFLASK